MTGPASARPYSQPLSDLRSGVYRHYKGPLYLVLGYGHDADQEGRVVVVYVGLQLDDAHNGPRLAVRTASDFTGFLSFVHDKDSPQEFGSKCNQWTVTDRPFCHCGTYPNNAIVQRFTYVGPTFEKGSS